MNCRSYGALAAAAGGIVLWAAGAAFVSVAVSAGWFRQPASATRTREVAANAAVMICFLMVFSFVNANAIAWPAISSSNTLRHGHTGVRLFRCRCKSSGAHCERDAGSEHHEC